MIRSVFKSWPMITVALLLSVFSASVCSAADGTKKLQLFAKNPATWAIVKGGASGAMSYRETTGAFSLTAVGLASRMSYALIRLDEAARRVEILSKGVSDGSGRLGLSGIWQNWNGKFWVVTGDDLTAAGDKTFTFRAWHPDRYLFEEKPLGIACACPDAEETK